MSAAVASKRLASCFLSSRRGHTRCSRDWSSDVCSSDLRGLAAREAHYDGGGGESSPRSRRVCRERSVRSSRSLSSQASARSSRLLDRDLLLFSLGFRRLGQCHSEYAVLEACLDLVGIHAVGKLEGALEGAKAALRQIIVLFPLLLLFPLLALDGQEAVGELHLDIVLIEARQLCRNLVFLLLLDDVDGRGLAEGELAAPERLDVERGAAGRAARGAPPRIVEQVVDLAPEIGQGTPLAGAPLGRLTLRPDGQLGYCFSHLGASFMRWILRGLIGQHKFA